LFNISYYLSFITVDPILFTISFILSMLKSGLLASFTDIVIAAAALAAFEA